MNYWKHQFCRFCEDMNKSKVLKEIATERLICSIERLQD